MPMNDFSLGNSVLQSRLVLPVFVWVLHTRHHRLRIQSRVLFVHVSRLRWVGTQNGAAEVRHRSGQVINLLSPLL